MTAHPRRRWAALAAVLVLALVAPALAAPVPAGAASSGPWLKPGVPFTYQGADPSVVALGPAMYTYATNHGGADLPITWSGDGATWTARTQYDGAAGNQDGDVGYFNDGFPNVPWGIDNDRCDGRTPGCDPKEMWAPGVAFVYGRWVAFHAVKVHREPAFSPYGRFAIYASVADSPIGPFRPASSQAIVTTNATLDPAGAIDPEVYVDEASGRAFLLWKQEGNLSGNYPSIWARELGSTGTRFAYGSSPRKLMTVSQSWEGRIVENPSMTKVNGRLVLLYSGNNQATTSYGTGYAICSSPLGPCRKGANNPIIRSASGAYGTGGADGIVDDRGRFLAVYHAWTGASGGRGTGRRVQRVGELAVSGDRVSLRQRDLSSGAGPDSVWYHVGGGSYASHPLTIGGTYQPAAGDFTGDGRGDVIWYGAWDRPDSMWTGSSRRGSFGNASLDVRGTFVPVTGDFDGNGLDDVYWYQPGPDPIVADRSRSGSNFEPNARNDQLWLARSAGGWATSEIAMDWAAIPIVGDFDGDGDDDILWSQPGSGADQLWLFSRGVPTRRPITVSGSYRPVVGDFDGNGSDDIFWYGPGSAYDSIWWFDRNAGYRSTGSQVSGDQYRPFAGDFDGDGRDEITWYFPGPGYDSVWTDIDDRGGFRSTGRSIYGVYSVIVEDFDGNGIDDILWYS